MVFWGLLDLKTVITVLCFYNYNYDALYGIPSSLVCHITSVPVQNHTIVLISSCLTVVTANCSLSLLHQGVQKCQEIVGQGGCPISIKTIHKTQTKDIPWLLKFIGPKLSWANKASSNRWHGNQSNPE
jgi:hypothetical protein